MSRPYAFYTVSLKGGKGACYSAMKGLKAYARRHGAHVVVGPLDYVRKGMEVEVGIPPNDTFTDKMPEELERVITGSRQNPTTGAAEVSVAPRPVTPDTIILNEINRLRESNEELEVQVTKLAQESQAYKDRVQVYEAQIQQLEAPDDSEYLRQNVVHDSALEALLATYIPGSADAARVVSEDFSLVAASGDVGLMGCTLDEYIEHKTDGEFTLEDMKTKVGARSWDETPEGIELLKEHQKRDVDTDGLDQMQEMHMSDEAIGSMQRFIAEKYEGLDERIEDSRESFSRIKEAAKELDSIKAHYELFEIVSHNREERVKDPAEFRMVTREFEGRGEVYTPRIKDEFAQMLAELVEADVEHNDVYTKFTGDLKKKSFQFIMGHSDRSSFKNALRDWGLKPTVTRLT